LYFYRTFRQTNLVMNKRSKTDIKMLKRRRIKDETAFLLATRANRIAMKKAMEDLKAGKGIVIPLEDLWK
jgi:hypothetical protein